MKSEIYNLIILDESGSMGCVKAQTISGCNETIQTIQTAQEKFGETQEHFVSIFSFNSDGREPSRYIIKNLSIAKVELIHSSQYNPSGCTPLYDAIGCTLTDLKIVTKDNQFAIGSVTIITDGMENSSTQYSRHKIAMMIEALKERGWSFNFIGANIDVEGTARSLNIDNAMEFTQDAEGTTVMFEKERRSRMGWLSRTDKVMSSISHCCCDCAPNDEEMARFKEQMREAADNYFDEDRGVDINK